MKKMTIFLACLPFTAPFAFAEEYQSPADPMDTVLLAQLQTQDRDQLQTPDKDQLKTQDRDQLQTPDKNQLQDRTQAQVDMDDPDYLQAMHQHQFSKQNVLSIQDMIREAQMQGLPTEPMQNKIHEGIAKSADEEAIVRAVKQVQNRYEIAYQHARSLADDQQQVRILGNQLAEANAAGFSKENTAQLMEQLHNRTRNMDREHAFELADETIKGVRNMARHGVSSATVANVYSNAIKHGYQAKEMQILQMSFAKQAMHGNPENIANSFYSDIGRGMGAGSLGASGGSSTESGSTNSSGSGSTSGSTSGSGSGSTSGSGSGSTSSSGSSSTSGSGSGSTSSSGSSSTSSSGSGSTSSSGSGSTSSSGSGSTSSSGSGSTSSSGSRSGSGSGSRGH